MGRLVKHPIFGIHPHGTTFLDGCYMTNRRTTTRSRGRSPYKKKISFGESRERKLLIMKNQLGKFPPPGTSFSVQFHEIKITTMITSVPCECRGPDYPHVHYFVDLEGLWDQIRLETGEVVSLIQERKGAYLLHRDAHL